MFLANLYETNGHDSGVVVSTIQSCNMAIGGPEEVHIAKIHD